MAMGFWEWASQGDTMSNGMCLVCVIGFVIVAVVAMIKGYEI